VLKPEASRLLDSAYCFFAASLTGKAMMSLFETRDQSMKFAITLMLAAIALPALAQSDSKSTSHPESYWMEGLWQSYEGEWTHVTRQVLALAEATPADKYGWRPTPGVRSFSEVYMHIATANFYLLSRTGPKLPPGMSQDMETKITDKAEVIDWLTRSFEAVKVERPKVQHADFGKTIKINAKYSGPVDGLYMRIIVHANEHMGQAIAYARMAGFAPPWSKTE
jgi:uncharacterized damage-inducible protein DinB